MGLGVGWRAGSAEQIGDEGAGRRAREKFLRWELKSDEREDGEMKNKRMKKINNPVLF